MSRGSKGGRGVPVRAKRAKLRAKRANFSHGRAIFFALSVQILELVSHVPYPYFLTPTLWLITETDDSCSFGYIDVFIY